MYTVLLRNAHGRAQARNSTTHHLTIHYIYALVNLITLLSTHTLARERISGVCAYIVRTVCSAVYNPFCRYYNQIWPFVSNYKIYTYIFVRYYYRHGRYSIIKIALHQ